MRKWIFAALLVVLLGTTMCTTEEATEEPEEAAEPVEEEVEEPEEEEMAEEEEEMPEAEEMGATLAIEHFSVIEGTTWSGAHDRAGQRIAEKYDNVDYVYREAVGPDLAVPYAQELIADGATIVIGNAEFMGLPLKDIAKRIRLLCRATIGRK